jgi:multisubunit Na+/H+ antiporter MnhB subunit
MDALLDSLKVVRDDYWLILAILLFIGWGTLIVFAILKRVEEEHLSDADRSALALAGWPAPLLLVSCLFLLLHIFISPGIAFAGAGVLLAASAGFALLSISNRVRAEAALPVLVFLILVFLRLGFVSKVTLPPYFDSAEHYRIIKSLLSGEGFNWPAASYYHLGYHTITSMLTSFSGAGINQVMLIFGQIICALCQCIFWWKATGSRSAAVACSGGSVWLVHAGTCGELGKYPAAGPAMPVHCRRRSKPPAGSERHWQPFNPYAAIILIASCLWMLLASQASPADRWIDHPPGSRNRDRPKDSVLAPTGMGNFARNAAHDPGTEALSTSCICLDPGAHGPVGRHAPPHPLNPLPAR